MRFENFQKINGHQIYEVTPDFRPRCHPTQRRHCSHCLFSNIIIYDLCPSFKRYSQICNGILVNEMWKIYNFFIKMYVFKKQILFYPHIILNIFLFSTFKLMQLLGLVDKNDHAREHKKYHFILLKVYNLFLYEINFNDILINFQISIIKV